MLVKRNASYRGSAMESIQGITIRNYETDDYEDVIEIAKALPEWFTKNGITKMKIDLRFQNGLVANIESEIIGFVSFFTVEGDGHIGWMGIIPQYHRQGIGSKLIDHLKTKLKDGGVKSLNVLTLGDSVDYEPYARTRAFYRAVGFEDHRRYKTDDPECPEQLVMKMDL
jgi:ribosomal protein S18 acetylase RimI-like enzyme